ncbi:MAG: 4-hydroxy-3-methylbut-2-enyl diphosphate reductase, partial [Spirosomaceae bacterium]|nr:4-hydroxy-3-methylbut-2-enyl diphosphate reductase [Spirosomataceae bacterium]
DWNTLTTDDIVVVPAFGTTVEIQSTLKGLGIDPYKYDTTCPFVEKVWKRADQIGNRGYSVIVHGKPKHEETRATFSHSRENAPTVIVRDMEEAQHLAKYIRKELPAEQFIVDFAGQFSEYFNPETDLERIGVVNQTTMLASETQGISDYLKSVIVDFYGLSQEESERNFANTRDTLCYATNDNQDATHALLKEYADFAVVVGGYNSSNTMHLVELCEEKLPTYFVESHLQIVSDKLIKHFNLHTKKEEVTEGFIPDNKPVTIMLTCGASCPDAVVEEVLLKLVSFFKNTNALSQVLASL